MKNKKNLSSKTSEINVDFFKTIAEKTFPRMTMIILIFCTFLTIIYILKNNYPNTYDNITNMLIIIKNIIIKFLDLIKSILQGLPFISKTIFPILKTSKEIINPLSKTIDMFIDILGFAKDFPSFIQHNMMMMEEFLKEKIEYLIKELLGGLFSFMHDLQMIADGIVNASKELVAGFAIAEKGLEDVANAVDNGFKDALDDTGKAFGAFAEDIEKGAKEAFDAVEKALNPSNW